MKPLAFTTCIMHDLTVPSKEQWSKYPKSVDKQPHRLLNFAVIGSQIEKYRTRRLELGQSQDKATCDTIVFLSLLGPAVFYQGISILRHRKLLKFLAEVYYAGPLCVGVGFSGVSPGKIVNMTCDWMYLYRSHCMLSTDCVKEYTEELVQARLLSLVPSLVEKIAQEEELSYCALCMERPPADGKVLTWPHCNHWFCRPCITKWVGKLENDSCPICCQSLSG